MKNWTNGRLDTLLEKVNVTFRFNSVFAPELANNWNMTVSQDSAATSLSCGGICNDHFVVNFVLSLAVKEFWKLVNNAQSYQHELGVLFFWLWVYLRKLLYHNNSVLRTLASLPVVYYEYISLCPQYAIKDPLCSRMYIRESVWNVFITVHFSFF